MHECTITGDFNGFIRPISSFLLTSFSLVCLPSSPPLHKKSAGKCTHTLHEVDQITTLAFPSCAVMFEFPFMYIMCVCHVCVVVVRVCILLILFGLCFRMSVLLYVHVYVYVLLHFVCALVTYKFGNSQVCIHVRMPNVSSHAFVCQYLYIHVQIHEYSDAHKERKKDKAAQHTTPETTFPKK